MNFDKESSETISNWSIAAQRLCDAVRDLNVAIMHAHDLGERFGLTVQEASRVTRAREQIKRALVALNGHPHPDDIAHRDNK